VALHYSFMGQPSSRILRNIDPIADQGSTSLLNCTPWLLVGVLFEWLRLYYTSA
jgi:hypothetical protein